MADAAVTWLGDEDPSQQVIEQYSYTFVKGEPTLVDPKSDAFKKLEGNAYFSVKKVDPVQSKEPEQGDPDAGSEIAAVRTDLDELGVKWDKRHGIDTLRSMLAKALQN